jgi:hypothetical protein
VPDPCLVRDKQVPASFTHTVGYTDLGCRHLDPTAPGRLRYPAPVLGHRNYPMYTPGGFDRRWVSECEVLERSDVKWVGNMMCEAPFESA